ncbi:CBS domain-containing protein [Candidatus Pacearchaeota archaeon]|nr:CBS domain-containing protein [Candidatus Pacearchaeota archaeon]
MVGSFVKDIMKTPVLSIDSSMTVKDAAKMMEDAKVGSIVVTENSIILGILTERDFVRKIVAQGKPLSTKVKDIMSSPLIVISPDETVWELASLMKTRRIHRVPVVEKGRLVGIASTADLTRLCSIGSDSEMSRLCEQILLRMKSS